MNANDVNKKRIAKNTIYLYVRMILSLSISFYTVRLLINYLGIQDYGIFNLVFGFVTMFTVLNDALARMVRRFFCYELGRNNIRNCRIVFAVSLCFFIVSALLILIAAETCGLCFVHNKINVPLDKKTAVQVIYQLAILSVVLRTLTIPFFAAITACEKMHVFAKISVAECLCNLLNVLLLNFFTNNKLVIYSSLFTITSILMSLCYVVYCCVYLKICRPLFIFDRHRVLAMGGFFSWSTFGAIANMSKRQGINVLLNVFCGTVLNATWALSNKISSAISQLTTSFQTAFEPQIIKSYTKQDKSDFFDLIISTTRYSFFLLWVFALPVLMNTDFLLRLWLENSLPAYLIVYVQLVVCYAIIDAINGPLWIAVQANGKIGKYQMHISLLILLSFLISWWILAKGIDCVYVPFVAVVVNFATWFYRLVYFKIVYRLPLKLYFFATTLPILGIIVISMGSAWGLRIIISNNFLAVFAIALVNCLWMFVLGLTKKEKLTLFQILQKSIR